MPSPTRPLAFISHHTCASLPPSHAHTHTHVYNSNLSAARNPHFGMSPTQSEPLQGEQLKRIICFLDFAHNTLATISARHYSTAAAAHSASHNRLDSNISSEKTQVSNHDQPFPPPPPACPASAAYFPCPTYSQSDIKLALGFSTFRLPAWSAFRSAWANSSCGLVCWPSSIV